MTLPGRMESRGQAALSLDLLLLLLAAIANGWLAMHAGYRAARYGDSK